MENFGDYLKIYWLLLVPAICEEIAFRTAFMSGLERLGKVGCFSFVRSFSLWLTQYGKTVIHFCIVGASLLFSVQNRLLAAAMMGHFINNFIGLP